MGTVMLILLAGQLPGAMIVGWFLDHSNDESEYR